MALTHLDSITLLLTLPGCATQQPKYGSREYPKWLAANFHDDIRTPNGYKLDLIRCLTQTPPSADMKRLIAATLAIMEDEVFPIMCYMLVTAKRDGTLTPDEVDALLLIRRLNRVTDLRGSARACPQLSQMIAAARWIAARKLPARLS
jgi:hypothetical protein